MNFISLFSVFSLIFSGFLGVVLGDNLKNIDFYSQNINIEGYYEVSSPNDEDSYKTNFTIKGIHKKDKSKYNVFVDSKDENFNLKYFSDKNGYYFDTNSLKELAGERANDNLKRIYSEYIKVDNNTCFGFKSKYPIYLIDNFLNSCADKKNYDSIISISKKLSALKLNTRMIKDKSKYTLYINMEDIVKDASLISKYILDNYEIFSNDIERLAKNINISPKEFKNTLVYMQDESYFNNLLMFSKGTNFVFNFYDDQLNGTSNISVNADIIIGSKEDYVNLISKFKFSFKNTKENVALPTTFTEVTSDEYNKFYLPSISDLCSIVLKDKDNNIKEIYFKKYPVLHDNNLYVDETVIKQFSDDTELFRDHMEFTKDKNRLYVYSDYYVLGDKVYSKKINLLPLRPILEFFGYNIHFQRDPSGFFNIEVKK